MIFSMRQLQEKAVEQQKAPYVVFVDFSKDFHTVERETLWKGLETNGCPDRLINFITLFHDGMMEKVAIGGDISKAFDIKLGVEQGRAYWSMEWRWKPPNPLPTLAIQ